jgi:hypothetical protein
MALRPPPVRESRLAESTLVYGGGRLAADSASRIARRADGLVLRGKSGAKLVRTLRKVAPDVRIMFDPSLYERPPASQLSLMASTESELLRQTQMNPAAFLSPSRFVPEAERSALSDVLAEGDEFCRAARSMRPLTPSLIVLPITKYWLTKGLDELVNALSATEERVALVLGDQNDPLDGAEAVRGLVAVVASRQGISLLRSDLAVLGAIAHGAEIGAIGTGTSVRHFVQPGKRGGGVPRDKTASTLVPALLSYVKGSKLGQVPESNYLLRCFCRVCEGQSLVRFGDERLVAESHEHSVETWSAMAEQIRGSEPSVRPRTWRSACADAIEAHQELSISSGVLFEASNQLKAWAEEL